MQNNKIEVYVELLDEGTETWRPTEALDVGNELFKLLPASDYDPEDEIWAFLPGDVVRVEKAQFGDGTMALIARHQNPDAVRMHVNGLPGGKYAIYTTNAVNVGNDLYKILPTPQYDADVEHWEFPPDSIVRLKKIESAGFTHLTAVKK